MIDLEQLILDLKGCAEKRVPMTEGRDTKLEYFKWDDLYMVGSWFDRVEFHQIQFDDCDLKTSNFFNCKFIECNFTSCNFEGSKFDTCEFISCNFDRCNLRRVNFDCHIPAIRSRFFSCRMDSIVFWDEFFVGSWLSGSSGIFRLPVGDPRGYDALAVQYNGKWEIRAGCRLHSIECALRHWSNKEYYDQEIGSRYVKAIEWLKEKIDVS